MPKVAIRPILTKENRIGNRRYENNKGKIKHVSNDSKTKWKETGIQNIIR